MIQSPVIQEFRSAPAHDVDLLFWIGGNPQDAHLVELVDRTVDRIRSHFADWHVTLLIDGPEWEGRAPDLPCGRRIVASGSSSLPQLLYAIGLERPAFAWAGFIWPGSEPDAGVFRELRDGDSDAALVYAEGVIPIPAGTSHPVQHGRLNMFNGTPMERCLVATRTAAEIAFDGSAIHQRSFWWDFSIRLTRQHKIASRACGSTLGASLSWTSYPFLNPISIDADTADRFSNHGNDFPAFLNDLKAEEAQSLEGKLLEWDGASLPVSPAPRPTIESKPPWPMRILVLGGIFEPHHNELCFFRSFRRLRGKGFITWRTALYENCGVDELRRYDLVIFSRPRDPNCRLLMDAARDFQVPTIVMIDDNWMALGVENERYRPLFAAGQPQMETFLHCVRNADVTVVYNRVLAEDVAPYARQVIELPPNVDPLAYAPNANGGANRPSGLLVGYSGSQRPDTGAFPALARFARNHADVVVLFIGPQLPAELAAIDPARVRWAPFQMNYEEYAKRIAALQPDILLAPLDESRASASKAPNKFLEISVLGAAGIFSRVEPYTTYVDHGKTGLLVGNAEDEWSDALERLHGDRALRTSIASAARDYVLEHHSMDRVIPRMLEMFAATVS